MCGLTGFWQPPAHNNRELQSRVSRMALTLEHRGPDDSGAWTDSAAGIALGFRRLAILDLSPEGHQPMLSESGRYVIAFNGEIYNFAALRDELSPLGHRFRGHSDTEALLAAIEEWGLEPAIRRCVGMFAIALWDRQERQLSLTRDRLGIKPLYYGWSRDTLLFGSELKALRAHPEFEAEIDRGALSLYFRHGYIPQPYSIYKGIYKLSPGTIITLRSSNDHKAPAPYWSARDTAERGDSTPFAGSPSEAVEDLDRLLREAVAIRMVADVPLGAFLSGGVDSSTVVALMQAQSQRPVKTFSIGFHEEDHNEAHHAAAVARHLGTEHTELYVTSEEAQAAIPGLAGIYDEPFADSSQIPTYLVSKLTRQHVTVSLSGDGGDELFCGYPRYFSADSAWSINGRIPIGARRPAGRALQWIAQPARKQQASSLLQRIGRRVDRAGELLSLERPETLYRSCVSHSTSLPLVIDGSEPVSTLSDPVQWPTLSTFLQRMMYLDTVTYLPDDILVKVDRASMAVSLEARVPLLDHRVVEFANTIPISLKSRERQSKWILRQALYRYVPRELIERPKMGFGVPISAWMRGPLREWAESLIDEKRLREEGFLNPEPVHSRWREHLSGQMDWGYWIWNILMFQSWLDRWRASPTVPELAAAGGRMARE